MKMFIKPMILVILAAVLISLTILPIPTYAKIIEMPGNQVTNPQGWHCLCPVSEPNCGCMIIQPPKE